MILVPRCYGSTKFSTVTVAARESLNVLPPSVPRCWCFAPQTDFSCILYSHTVTTLMLIYWCSALHPKSLHSFLAQPPPDVVLLHCTHRQRFFFLKRQGTLAWVGFPLIKLLYLPILYIPSKTSTREPLSSAFWIKDQGDKAIQTNSLTVLKDKW